MKILQTERLLLRWFAPQDADAVLALLTDAAWLRFIGERGVHTRDDAAHWIQEQLVASYQRQGFGLWAMQRLEAGQAAQDGKEGKDATGGQVVGGQVVGMCGLVKREWLDALDLGFALLPAHRGQGYVREAGAACLRYAHEVLGKARVLAITRSDNEKSAASLRALGLRHLGTCPLPEQQGTRELYEWRPDQCQKQPLQWRADPSGDAASQRR